MKYLMIYLYFVFYFSHNKTSAGQVFIYLSLFFFQSLFGFTIIKHSIGKKENEKKSRSAVSPYAVTRFTNNPKS